MKKLLSTLILFAFAIVGMAQQGSFAPQGAEWYFNVASFMGSPISYYHMEVLGDTVIQGHQCSVISRQFLGGNGDEQYVFEDNGKVYWYNQTLGRFTTLYDFDAEVGESWTCEIDSCAYEVTVTELTYYEGSDHNQQFRAQRVSYDGELGYFGGGTIIDGIGEISGLFPYPYACMGDIYDGQYPDWLRCYLVDGEMVLHLGAYDCDEQGYCWDGTVAEAYAGGDGTPENPYQIATSQQLALLAQQTNDGTGGDAYYVLTDDISLSACTGATVEWTPIGMPVLTPGNGPLDTTFRYFTGHFDGQNHSIFGMKQVIENGELEPVGGLFGCTDNAEIKSVRLLQCSVTGNGKYVGGLVGHAGRTDISGCSISYGSSILTNHWHGVAGGLIGYAGTPFGRHGVGERTIHLTNCYVQQAVTVHGSWAAGGIVGEVNKDYSLSQTPCEISNCSTLQYYQAFCIQSESAAGGIVGRMINGSITDCKNQYKVIGADTYGVGGIVGEAEHVTVSQCTNGDFHYSDYGEIVGEYACGGIVGRSPSEWISNPHLDVIDCENYGRVTGHNTTSGTLVGGIVGAYASNIIRCFNKGNVTATVKYSGAAGGITGNSLGTIANCFNRGNVNTALDESADDVGWLFAGGIAGTPDSRIYNVYNTGAVSGPDLSAFPDVLVGYGNIIGYGIEGCHYLNAYWLDNDLPACGHVNEPELHGSSAFHSGMTSTKWQLNEPQYGTTDLLEALNYGAVAVFDSVPQYSYLTVWLEDYNSGWNNGFPRIGNNVGPGLNSFVVDDLCYSVISFDPATVCLEGVREGSEGPSTLVIPDTVNYYGLGFTVTKIAEYAFMNWRRWRHDLVIPNSVTEIGSHAFEYTAFTGPLSIPNSVVRIGDRAFYDCLDLTELTLSDNLLTIGEAAFCKCGNMNGILTLPEGLTTIGSAAFVECGFTGSLVIPNSVDSIGAAAFKDCHFNGQLRLPDGLQKLEHETFMNCAFTGRLNLPSTITKVGSQAFDGCQFGDTLVIPESLTFISDGVFNRCNQLETLMLPSTLRGISFFGFARCTNLRSITIDAYLPPSTQEWAFDFIPNDIPVYIPNGSLCAYQAHNVWNYFTNFIEEDGKLPRSEWYYEILNENGSITYQHLEYAADTTINNKDVKIIIRTNTLYDKSGHTDVTREYIYEEDCRVYWWNPTLQEFTVLYDYDAREGSEWEIKVGTESIIMHVDAVELYEYDGRQYKTLHVRDAENFFSGIIVCNIGHLTSFFPERLMTKGKAYRVEGIRCYWREGELVFKYGDRDCDEVYEQIHNGLGEMDDAAFAVYPNPTDGVLFIRTHAVRPYKEYRITNLTGQTVLAGDLNAETQQIDVSNLPQGMYFITFAGETRKFVVQ